MQLVSFFIYMFVFFFKQKTAYELRISDWSSDVCSSDLQHRHLVADRGDGLEEFHRILDRHVEDVGDGLALELHLQRLAIVAGAVADVAGEIGKHTSELQSLMRISYAVFCLHNTNKSN